MVCLIGVGFIMSFFIGGFVFVDLVLMIDVCIGVLIGFLILVFLGIVVLVLVVKKFVWNLDKNEVFGDVV